MRRLYQRAKFALEKLLLRGAHYQLILIAVLIALVSLIAGGLVFLLTGAFPTLGGSMWWAFLRLSDPGYLGDDRGLVLQLISTVVTILGYVLFMGALIAIMTQWLQRTMRRLESGLTPITLNDHVLILGWTNRTAAIVRELVSSEGKVKRFLRRIGARRLRIVILAEEVTTALHLELRDSLGKGRRDSLVTFRTGSPLRADHLKRVDFVHAGVIILPGSDLPSDPADLSDPSGGVDLVDSRTIKTLLTIASYHHKHPEERQPLIVAELADGRRAPVVRSTYGSQIELVAGDQVISRLMAQNLRHSGLSGVYNELLTHSRGNALYVREWPAFAGRALQGLWDAFPRAIVLGVLREAGGAPGEVRGALRPLLNPAEGLLLEEDDRIVFLARTWSDTEPSGEGTRSDGPPRSAPVGNGVPVMRRVLVLGWNHKVPALVGELQRFAGERFELDILSLVPALEREGYLRRMGPTDAQVRHLEGDYTALDDLRRVEPDGYDRIVFLSSNWLGSHEESDARTILGYLVLRGLLAEGRGASGADPVRARRIAPEREPGVTVDGSADSAGPAILVELMNPDNEALLPGDDREVLITSEIISHMIAHIALRRELRVVFDELFSAGGAEISLREARHYGLGSVGRGGRVVAFRDAAETVASHGDILLGYRPDREGIVLNPPRDAQLSLAATTRLVVLTSYGEPSGSATA
jgi:hypothetical protein